MNLLPNREMWPVWGILLISILGYIIGKPEAKAFLNVQYESPLEIAVSGEPVFMILDFSPESWDEMSPAFIQFSKDMLNNGHVVYFFSTNILLTPWLENFSKKINTVSSTEERKALSKFVGFLPGSPAAIIEILRAPSLVISDFKIENPEDKLMIVFTGDDDYHKWFFYGWSRYKNRIVLIVPSILYPEALVYKNAGEAIEIYQGLLHLKGSNINRRKALVSWFIFSLIGMSLLRLLRAPVFIWRVRRFKKFHKMMK